MKKMQYEKSAHWKPDYLVGKDTTNFRYIPNITQRYKTKILHLMNDLSFRIHIGNYCPRHILQGKWEEPVMHVSQFLTHLDSLSALQSHAASRIIDENLTHTLDGGVLIARSSLDEVEMQRLLSRWQILRHTTYESMPTDILYETIGGASLAVIHNELPRTLSARYRRS